jgi:hypothetical protein
VSGKRENGFEQTDFRVADGKLRRVNADRETAGAGRPIVTSKPRLVPFVETALRIER